VGKLRSAAEIAFSKGEVDQALQLWEKVIKLEPNNEQNYYKRFRIYLRQQKLKEALSDLNSALAIKPDFEAVLSQRGKINLRMGYCNQAEEDLLRLQKINPASKDVELAPQASACKAAMNKAEVFYTRGQWAPAREHLSEALRYAESSSSLLFKRATSSFHVGDTYEAIADTGKVLKAEPENIQALELRGNCYYVLNELDMAMNHYRQGLKYDPEHNGCKGGYRLIKKLQGFLKKADEAVATKNPQSSIKYLQSAIEVDPEHKFIVPKCTHKIAEAYRSLKQYNEAKEAVQKAIDLDARLWIVTSSIRLSLSLER
jgi:tetratricopeptide (TPR) repeat protein